MFEAPGPSNLMMRTMKPIDSDLLDRSGWQYDNWHHDLTDDIDFYVRQARKYGSPILELACGIGRITLPIAQEGFKITGVDISEGMLQRAKEKAMEQHLTITWSKADIRNFTLYEKFNLIFLPFNSISHLQDLDSIAACFQAVKHHLAPDGRFILDIANPKLEFLLRESHIKYPVAEYQSPDSHHAVIVSESSRYDRAQQINYITCYYKIGEKEFTHELNMRIFFPQELDALLKFNGFFIEAKYGDFHESSFSSSSERQILVSCIQ